MSITATFILLMINISIMCYLGRIIFNCEGINSVVHSTIIFFLYSPTSKPPLRKSRYVNAAPVGYMEGVAPPRPNRGRMGGADGIQKERPNHPPTWTALCFHTNLSGNVVA